MEKLPSYVLITPARDEAEFIELTIRSVVAQTVPPLKWVIVSDGSTDGTDEIVRKYTAQHPWIELIRIPERRERNFAGKVQAFNAGWARVRDLEYEAIGCMDGDISFDEHYFAFLLQRLAESPSLGVVGTAFRDKAKLTYDYRFVSIEHVTGCCQLFRRACFEAIGGYVPVKGGAVDSIAVISARMKGWETRTFADKLYLHHRQFGSAANGVLAARFKNGLKDYAVGNHPIWEAFRIGYQMRFSPVIVGALILGAGYFWGLACRRPRPISDEMVDFVRREQMRRLRALPSRLFG
jgi:glycosyltransferase involved in cell wall biosynthesis